MQLFENIINDRGSKYSVCGAPPSSKYEALAVLKALKKIKKYAKATHNTWAVLLSDGGPLRNDDGEAGAGMVIVSMLEREKLFEHLVVVIRWFGGTKLGGDRLRRVQNYVTYNLENS